MKRENRDKVEARQWYLRGSVDSWVGRCGQRLDVRGYKNICEARKTIPIVRENTVKSVQVAERGERLRQNNVIRTTDSKFLGRTVSKC